jgi:Leucine-rich repeat (LRR) protein
MGGVWSKGSEKATKYLDPKALRSCAFTILKTQHGKVTMTSSECGSITDTSIKANKRKMREIGNLSRLTKLNLHGSKITSLPDSVGRLQNLQELHLGLKEALLSLPKTVGGLVSLTKLSLHGSKITSLPASIGPLQNLQELHLLCTD